MLKAILIGVVLPAVLLNTRDDSTMEASKSIVGCLCQSIFRLCLPFAFMFGVFTVNGHAAEIAVSHLRCEDLLDPLGIDVAKPRLSWTLESDRFNERQAAYEVVVDGQWDSGRVASAQSINVEYAGKELAPATRYTWKVRVWDAEGKPSAWSKTAIFSTALKNWTASWIGRDEAQNFVGFEGAQWIWFPEGNPALSAPAGTRYFRRTVAVPAERTPVKATCVITADSSFELSINGEKAGEADNFHHPANWDVTRLLRPGDNAVEIKAAHIGVASAGVIGKLFFEYADGNQQEVTTDQQWEASLDRSSWRAAKTIGAAGMKPWGPLPNARRLPARYLRHEFQVTKRVTRATAHVSGLGFFELYLNGAKVSQDMMDPALSDPTKAVYAVTFDVTGQMRAGANAVGVILGNGRFYAPRLQTPAPTMSYGYPKLLLQLQLEYADGTMTAVSSDDTWRLTTNGPIRANNEYDGEEYDARLEMPGWDRAGFDDAKWENAQLVASPGGALKAQTIQPMQVMQVVRPAAISNPAPGTYIVDMGQNFYGTVRLKAAAPRGTEVSMTSAYSLNPDGTLKTADNRSARATDIYTFKGEGQEVWNPRFKGQGFRRVEVTGFPGTLTIDNFEGLAIYTAVEPTGDFQSSNEFINKLHRSLWWGMQMFLRSAPIDPDRDERQPWVGDPAKDAESQAYNWNVGPFYAKWMNDVERSQRADGSLPDITMNWNWGDGVEWPSVFTIIPDWFVDFYGDALVAQAHYAAMKTWVLAMRRHELPDGTLKATGYGDWCDTYSMDGKTLDFGRTPLELVSSAYQYHNYRIMERLAEAMGKGEDERVFAGLAEKLKAAFNSKFLDSATHSYKGGTQTGYMLALEFGLAPQQQRDAIAASFIDDIVVKHSGHLSGGLVGMQWLMQTLTDIGRPDVAWTIATQTTRPSWGYMLSKGATSIWERWDYDTRDPGMNSEALLIQAGNLDAWFYQTLAGIRPAAPGFKEILIQPTVVGDLTWVKAHFDSPYGRIVSDWKIEGDRFTMNVTIPTNTTATIVEPGKNGMKHKVGSGHYQFSSQGQKWR
jgi:alpha-L-rhamnosidase